MTNLKNASKKLQLAALAGGLALTVCAPGMVKADNISFNFNSPTGELSTSQTYTATSSPLPGVTVTLTAYGYKYKSGTSGATKAWDLYGKSSITPSENGLGLADFPSTDDNEINPHGFIQLDLTNLLSALPSGNNIGALTIGSLQSPDTYAVYDSSVLGSLGTKDYHGTWKQATNGLYDLTVSLADFSTDPYLGLGTSPVGYCEANPTILLNNLSVTTTTPFPEPAALSMMGLAGLGILLLPRKRVTNA